MSVLIGSSNKSNTLLSAGSQHTIDNKHKSTLLIQESTHVCEVEECNEGELKIENCLSEFQTEEQKAAALRNLGIESIAQWGKIYGHIEDQKDLQELLKAKIDDNIQAKLNNLQNTFNTKIDKEREGLTATQQINYNLNTSDYLLNENFKKAVEDLKKINELDSLTLNDAMNILFHALFPIEYKDWTLTCNNNISLERKFEKGTSYTVDGNTKIGDIIFKATPGNLQNSVNFEFNNNTVQNNKSTYFEFSKAIYVKDIVDSFTFTQEQTKSKNYEYKLYDAFTNKDISAGSITATLKLSTQQYYYYFSDSNDLLNQKVFKRSDLTTPSTDLSSEYHLNTSEKYIYVLSPKQIKQVFTAAASSQTSLDSAPKYESEEASASNGWSGWQQKQVTYIPTDGTPQTSYWIMRLGDKQSSYVKIEIKV